ncbi:MAG TPA: biosynthetic peptidoglycan transglycosylase [Sphingomicrobium sp.]|jgi:membrane peptidoglycan carboxypeptidase
MRRRPGRHLLYALCALVLAFVLWEAFALVRAHERTPAALATARSGELQPSDLPPQRKAMLLKVEDPGFYEHRGVDFSTPGQGATTITQALVKRLYFDRGFKPGFAKIEQSLIARFVFDPALSKDEQLRAYLNHAYFGRAGGRQLTGYAAAARTYHGREFRQLSDEQFLSLVAMTIAPNELSPLRHAEANRERVRRIQKMLTGKCAPTAVRDVRYASCA